MGCTKKQHCVFSTRWQASYLELEMSNYSRFGNRNSAGTSSYLIFNTKHPGNNANVSVHSYFQLENQTYASINCF